MYCILLSKERFNVAGPEYISLLMPHWPNRNSTADQMAEFQNLLSNLNRLYNDYIQAIVFSER